MTTGKNRLEAFSDGMFAIILTVLVLELKVPQLADSSFPTFLAAMGEIAPKLLSFLFSFFILAIFWVNHHHLVHAIQKVDAKLLWLNMFLLFFACLFPFLTAFIGDYPLNSWVVALFPLNMAMSSVVLRAFWKHAFVDSNLAPNTLTAAEKKARLRQETIAALVNLVSAALAFVWVPITLAIMIVMPFLFVVPELIRNKSEE
ncbi:MAG: TMEM175 family protein [Spirochaetales bacterium]